MIWDYNYTSKDPVLREIFNDLRFRRARSHAINRVEFGEVFNLGLTEPRQAAPPADWSFYDESFGPYVTAARAKGLTEMKLIATYPVRIAINPFVSSIGGVLPELSDILLAVLDPRIRQTV